MTTAADRPPLSHVGVCTRGWVSAGRRCGEGATRSCHDLALFTLSSAGEDAARRWAEVKMAATSPLSLFGEKWSQSIPDRSAGTAAQFGACDTLEDRLRLIQPASSTGELAAS